MFQPVGQYYKLTYSENVILKLSKARNLRDYTRVQLYNGSNVKRKWYILNFWESGFR